VLEEAGVGSLRAEVVRILSEGAVTATTVAPGSTFEWMATRRRGRPTIMRRVRWDGRRAFRAFQFQIDDRNGLFTFIVPEDCGNLTLVRRERVRGRPPRCGASRGGGTAAEEARKADDARKAELARQAEEARKADDARKAELARQAEEARKAELARQAEAARLAEEARKAEEARQAEAARLAAEEAALKIRPFVMGLFGKQHRQYDATDPADVGFDTNPVKAFGDTVFGVRGGISYRMSEHWRFNPSIGFAFNFHEASRSSLLADAELQYAFKRGPYLGTGITLWDFAHKDIGTLGWLGTAGVPVWKNDTKKHQLDFAVEWRQFFDRMSDPDVNYQFWGGLRYLFK
jgi:hypothetical protein